MHAFLIIIVHTVDVYTYSIMPTTNSSMGGG